MRRTDLPAEAGEGIAATDDDTGQAGFVRWYVDAFRAIQGDLFRASIEEHTSQEMAAQILNAAVFLGFARDALPQRAGYDRIGIADAPSLDAVWSRDARRAWPRDVLGKLDGALDRFSFSLVDEEPARAGRLVTPVTLDAASEALSRAIAGEEKIASRGAFYTQRAEISFMCSVAVFRHLENRFPRIAREELERIAFGSRSARVKHGGAETVSREDAEQIINTMLEMRVLDPACGSGAFLTGMADKRHAIVSDLAASSRIPVPGSEPLARRLVVSTIGVDSDALAVQVARVQVFLWYMREAGLRSLAPGGVDLPGLGGSIVHGDFFWTRQPQDAGAFDVVIGNPPYVRQEDIKPGNAAGSLPARAEKARYKEEVIAALRGGIPRPPRLSRTCDLYVYFFVKGMQSLAFGGELCLITSNSWLDAKFGRDLRAFLLENTSQLSIFDFSRRSFDRAEINTVITACTRRDPAGAANPLVSFVRFKLPPDLVIAIPTLRDPEAAPWPARTSTSATSGQVDVHRHVVDSPGARLVAVNQEALAGALSASGRTTGDKWRVEYLNEHDIFYTVLRKAAARLVPLGSIASVKAGCYSGINEFFYVDRQTVDRFGIEADYLRPLLRSARGVRSLAMSTPQDSYILAVPSTSKAALENRGHRGIAAYISWGEAQRTRRGQKTAMGIPWPRVESVRHRAHWYALSPGNLKPARLLMQYIAHDRFYCPWSVEPVVPDRCFHRIEPNAGIDLEAVAAALNSTLQAFIVMVTGRVGLGGGALKLESIDAKSMFVLDPRQLSRPALEEMARTVRVMGARPPSSLFAELGLDPSTPFETQVPSPLPDRAALDKVVFDELGLSGDERADVYRATCSAITNRLAKARRLARRGDDPRH